MSQFFQRVASYVANEIVIKGLANSRTFQRFAVRTNKQYEDFTKQGAEQLNKTLDDLAQQQARTEAASRTSSSALSGPPTPPLRGVPGFFVAFFKEIRKDVVGT